MVRRRSAIRESVQDRIFNFINISILTLFGMVIVFPLLYTVSVSLLSNSELGSRSGLILFPYKPSFDAYKLILRGSDDIRNGYIVTVSRTMLGTALNLTFTCFLAYLLSRKDLPFRKSITLYLLITMIFNGGLIPTYLTVISTGLRNSFLVYLIPGLTSVWNTLVMRNFMMEIPDNLVESAEIDGCSQVRVLFRIIIPLSKASLVTIGLFYAVGHWNSWFDAYLYIKNRDLFPLQLILRNILATATLNVDKLNNVNLEELITTMRPPTRSVQNAALVVTTLPILCVYPFVQKHFVKGVMVGSIKG